MLIDKSIDLSTSITALTLSSIIGVFSAYKLKNYSSSKVLFGILLIIFVIEILLRWLEVLPLASSIFFLSTLSSHIRLIELIYFISIFSTHLSLKSATAYTIETLILMLFGISILSGHRNFHFELPKFTQTISWTLGSSQLTTFILIGTLISLLTLIYLFFSPSENSQEGEIILGKRNILRYGVGSLLLLSLFIGSSGLIHSYFKDSSEASGKLTNGVGQAGKEGSSPLGFHSALGGSNEPAGLVRLDGDYKNNPFAPMLYLRESALSELQGNEIVLALKGFDNDVSRTSPSENFSRVQDNSLAERETLTQSVYLIAPHKSIFAIDYPIKIDPLKNPNTSKFIAAYRVVSAIPEYKLSEFENIETGDPSWTGIEWSHYLAVHSNKKYTELALNITKNEPTDIDKIRAIIKYLSKNAIYTLTPNHEVAQGDDPVEPFLFGDMRGYCVHFAHATVYMLRALGIPARIGTGYLTDLNQAKDGHILLRMSDRHAWAESYIRGYGWVPFDVQPEQVESHADTNVDMSMLEDLMGLLEPGDEILPEKILEGEKNVEDSPSLKLPELKYFIIPFLLLLVVFILTKLFLRYSWILSDTPSIRLRRAYISVASQLIERGHIRNTGETRCEFKKRLIAGKLNFNFTLAEKLTKNKFCKNTDRNKLSLKEISQALHNDLSPLIKTSIWKRIVFFANPTPFLEFFSRKKW